MAAALERRVPELGYRAAEFVDELSSTH
jgi:hypothetical protein